MSGEEIQQAVRDLHCQHDIAVETCRTTIQKIKSQITQLQIQCDHSRKYFCMGTPYDKSYYRCEICGKDDV